MKCFVIFIILTLACFFHPVYAFSNQPTEKQVQSEFHSNLQWWEILDRQQVMNIELFPPEFGPNQQIEKNVINGV